MEDFDLILNDDTEEISGEFYAQVILTTLSLTPLFADSWLAQGMVEALKRAAADAPGSLWGFVVLPESVRLVVGPTDDDRLETFVSQIKAQTEAHLLDLIRQIEDDSLDAVLRYNPMWGGVNYQVWQAGYHRKTFWTEYKLSNAIYELSQAPVDMGLVEVAEAWPYIYVGDEE